MFKIARPHCTTLLDGFGGVSEPISRDTCFCSKSYYFSTNITKSKELKIIIFDGDIVNKKGLGIFPILFYFSKISTRNILSHFSSHLHELDYGRDHSSPSSDIP